MKKMTVGAKLRFTGSILVLFTAILGAVSLLGLRGIGRSEQTLVDDAVAGIVACSKAEATLLELRGDVLRHIATPEASEKSNMDGRIQKLRQQLAAELEEVKKAALSEEERALNRTVQSTIATYLQSWDDVAPLSRALKNADALKLYVDRSALFTNARDAIHTETEYNRRLCSEYAAAAASTRGGIVNVTWILLAVSLVTGAGLTYVIVRSLNRDLTSAVNELTAGADQVTSAAAQVSSSSQSLAQGSSEQAASLEETSASTEEISSMAQASADNSRSATELVGQMQQRFVGANTALTEMLTAMNEIGDASSQISKIIKVIDEIAFQTNILALNAAVEAARAGEAGMGFAVVADEVRNLAQRCAQAAKDTTDLIEGSIVKSRNGKAKVDRVAGEVRAIAEQSEKVQALVEEINRGSAEQAKGITQVARAVSQMEGVTQTTAANAEESAAAAEELMAQSESVRTVVQTLELLVGGGGQRNTVAPPRSSTARSAKTAAKAPVRSASRPVAQPALSWPRMATASAGSSRASGELPLDDFSDF